MANGTPSGRLQLIFVLPHGIGLDDSSLHPKNSGRNLLKARLLATLVDVAKEVQ